MTVVLAMARDVSVDAGDPMGKSQFHERVERAVDSRRRRGCIGLEVGDQIVGLDRTIGFEKQFQRPLPQWRPAQARRFATFTPLRERRGQGGATWARRRSMMTGCGLGG